MRNVFLALLLFNLLFAAWSAWYAPLSRAGRSADDGLPDLTLVSEVPSDLRTTGTVTEPLAPPDGAEPGDAAGAEAPLPSPAESPIVAAVPPPVAASDGAPVAEAAGRCTSVGPFRELSQAATAAATLRTAGHQPLQRVAEGEIWIGYWVYIEAIPSEQEANAILARVRGAGITDSYVIPNSDSGSLVSLGVFSEISGVSRRRDQARALGLEPQVVDRTRRATVYWIDVTLGAGQSVDFDALQPSGRIIRLEQRPCEPAQR
jgi:cell division septation protein DedD